MKVVHVLANLRQALAPHEHIELVRTIDASRHLDHVLDDGAKIALNGICMTLMGRNDMDRAVAQAAERLPATANGPRYAWAYDGLRELARCPLPERSRRRGELVELATAVLLVELRHPAAAQRIAQRGLAASVPIRDQNQD